MVTIGTKSRSESASPPRNLFLISLQNDMLQWLMDEEFKREPFNMRKLARLVLIINFAAIHTSSNVRQISVHVQELILTHAVL